MRTFVVAAAVLALAAMPAEPYIEQVYPLQQFMAESEVIATGVVDRMDERNKTAVVRIEKSLKGKCAYPEIKMNLSAGQDWHPQVVMRHMVKGAPAVMFYNAERRGEIYINRFFMQLYGDAAAAPERTWWTFTHIEIRCNRTFNGPAPELAKLVADVVAGKAKAPAPDPKVPAIAKEHVLELPPHGQPVEEAKLPASFRKRDANAPVNTAAMPVDDQGFIRHWLVLGPIALGPQAGDHTEASQRPFFDREWVPNQKGVQPRHNDKVAVNGQEISWQMTDSENLVLDFGAADNSLHLAAAYVVAEAEMPDLTLAIGSDDSSIWWLNGQEVIRVYAGRGYGPDQDRSAKPVALRKGGNVLLAGVINGGGPTGLCARFLDKAGNPVKGIAAGGSPARKK